MPRTRDNDRHELIHAAWPPSWTRTRSTKGMRLEQVARGKDALLVNPAALRHVQARCRLVPTGVLAVVASSNVFYPRGMAINHRAF